METARWDQCEHTTFFPYAWSFFFLCCMYRYSHLICLWKLRGGGWTGSSTKKIQFVTKKADRQKCRQSLRRDEFSFPRYQFVSKLPTGVRDVAVTLKGSHSEGDGQIFLKISAPHSSMTTYRMNLISAGSISLDSTFMSFHLLNIIIIVKEFYVLTGFSIPLRSYGKEQY